MLSSDGRAAALYDVVKNQPGFALVNDTERAHIQAQLTQFFGADNAYLTANAQINPGTLANNAGQPVTTPLGPGATASPQVIIGLGTLS